MPTIPALRKQTGSSLSLRAAWSVFTASTRLGLHGETLFQNKRHTPKAVRADFKGGLEDGKQAEDTREDQTAWLQSCSSLLSAAMVPCYPMAVDVNTGKPGTVPAGGSSPNTPSSYGGVWLCSPSAVSSGAAQWSQGQAGPRIHQEKDRRTYSHTKRKGRRGTEQESSPP